MSSESAREARPDERPEFLLFSGGIAQSWGPGRTFLSRSAEGVGALARLEDPAPGDGYHREQVRLLRVAGQVAAVKPVARAAVEAAGPRLRVEAVISGSDAGLEDCFAEAGLQREVELPEAWRTSRGLEPFQLWGRPLASSRAAPRVARAETGPRPAGELRLLVHDKPTREALSVFLHGLNPGRAYPPGTLLSQAEEVETRRRHDLTARWVLALDGRGAVVGGVLLEPDLRPERAHVLRVHVDVVAAWRGHGVAVSLLRDARRVASRWEATRLEADPRSGNSGACRALEAAGFARAGEQPGAWRMRSPITAWDESLVFYSAPADP